MRCDICGSDSVVIISEYEVLPGRVVRWYWCSNCMIRWKVIENYER